MEEEKVYSKEVIFFDGSCEVLSATREQMVQYLKQHRKPRLIVEDTEVLFRNYISLYQLIYMRENKPKLAHGGVRPNSGRKAKADTEHRIAFRASQDVYDILQLYDNKTEFIEKAIREKHRREERY